ncbi:MAG TPA: hypothetical protein VFQ53_14430 [Kofleriaceae bacterium]|nr:hypothetical protein [Kofleriaceae bacterium]
MKTALALLACLFSTACSGRDAPSAPAAAAIAQPERPDTTIGGAVVPQMHEFPAGRAADIRRMFDNSVLSYPIAVVSKDGAQTQFVNPRPVFVSDRRFVVGLPPASHVALDKLIAALDRGPAASGATYEITFWAVEGAAAAKTEVAPDLTEIAPALEKLSALGKRSFKIVDRVGGQTRDGAKTKLASRLLHTEHRLTAEPEGLELDLTLQLQEPNTTPTIETTLRVPLDRPVIIGDSAQAGAADGMQNLLLYVVRAHRVE